VWFLKTRHAAADIFLGECGRVQIERRQEAARERRKRDERDA